MENLRDKLKNQLNKVSVNVDCVCNQLVKSDNEEHRRAFLNVLVPLVIQESYLEKALGLEHVINNNIELNRELKVFEQH